MSRIGRQKIIIPAGVKVERAGDVVTVQGPLGSLSRVFENRILLEAAGQEIELKAKDESPQTRALWGTYAAHLRNMISGVVKGFEKKLVLEGVGFRAGLTGDKLNLSLGFSHPVEVVIPQGLKVTVEKNIVVVSGADKESVGQFAAKVRLIKPPEPYKGKGIRYDGEVIYRKEGKKAVAAA